MSSQRKIDSCRANCSLSKGPVTEEGKKRSSQNAIRHGMLAQTVVFEGESVERFTAYVESLEAQYQPANPAEQSLIESMAVSNWMLQRIWGFGKATFDLEMAKV